MALANLRFIFPLYFSCLISHVRGCMKNGLSSVVSIKISNNKNKIRQPILFYFEFWIQVRIYFPVPFSGTTCWHEANWFFFSCFKLFCDLFIIYFNAYLLTLSLLIFSRGYQFSSYFFHVFKLLLCDFFFLIRHHMTFPLLFLFWLHSFFLALFHSFLFVFCFISVVSYRFSLSSSFVRFLSFSLLLLLHFPWFISSAFLYVYPFFLSPIFVFS